MSGPTRDDARKLLDTHGYSFQYAVIRRAEELCAQQRSKWVFEAAEFPVTGSHSQDARADFILRAFDQSVYLVAECKRANPALSNWCFIRAPYTRRNAAEDDLVFQEVPYRLAMVRSPQVITLASGESCHVGLELRSSEKGDANGRVGQAIEDAAAQVLRGSNGLIDHIFGGGWAPQEPGSTVFVPAIFTTAQLWIVEGDMAEADLRTGKLPTEWGSIRPTKWLWFNYNQSRSLRHHLGLAENNSNLAIAVLAEYTRSIAIIGPDGVDVFLRGNLVDLLTRGKANG